MFEGRIYEVMRRGKMRVANNRLVTKPLLDDSFQYMLGRIGDDSEREVIFARREEFEVM